MDRSFIDKNLLSQTGNFSETSGNDAKDDRHMRLFVSTYQAKRVEKYIGCWKTPS